MYILCNSQSEAENVHQSEEEDHRSLRCAIAVRNEKFPVFLLLLTLMYILCLWLAIAENVGQNEEEVPSSLQRAPCSGGGTSNDRQRM